MRATIQKMGWKKFMGYIAGIMAEQADRVPRDGKQDKALFHLSTILHSPPMVELFGDCGYFDYRKMMGWVPDDFKQTLEDNPPPETPANVS